MAESKRVNYLKIEVGEPMEGQLTHEQILNAISNGVIATDSAGHIVLMNKAAEKILGFNRKKTIGAYIPDLLPMTGDLVLKCLETGKPQLGQHIPGKRLKLVVNVTGIHEDNRIVGTVCNFEGMREFELTATKLESYKQLNEQLHAIFKSSSDGIWVSDGKGKVININEASEKLNGIKAKDVIGKNIKSIVKEGLIDRSATLEALATKRQVNIMQYTSKTNKYLLLTGTPVFDKKGNISLVIVNERDMTNLNALQEQLDQTRMVTEKFKDELAELSMMELKKQEIIAESEEMRQVLRVALKLAHLEASNILILGESGTGKGLLAKFIHKNSKRRKKPLIQINCAALPENLLEAELFGYEKGAFTGAREQGKVGDEIGDLPLPVQAKLLKYLDDQEIMRLGGTKPKKVDCTIIAATNRDLETLRKTRRFREDLFYRLNAFMLRIPPLRERPEDIFDLVNYFLRKYSKRYRLKRRISPDTLEALQSYSFPGNVRELKNILKMAVVMGEKDLLDEFIIRRIKGGREERKTHGKEKSHFFGLSNEVLAFEKDLLRGAMVRCKSTRDMASYLRVSQPTVVRKMKRHGLSRSSI